MIQCNQFTLNWLIDSFIYALSTSKQQLNVWLCPVCIIFFRAATQVNNDRYCFNVTYLLLKIARTHTAVKISCERAWYQTRKDKMGKKNWSHTGIMRKWNSCSRDWPTFIYRKNVWHTFVFIFLCWNCTDKLYKLGLTDTTIIKFRFFYTLDFALHVTRQAVVKCWCSGHL